MSDAIFRLRWAALALMAIWVNSVAWAQESDPHRGPQTATGWGFFPAAHRDAALPNVILMGDSILGGYRGEVIAELKGKANVDVFLNAYHQASADLYPKLEDALGHGPYAVIHFNLGLHGWDKGRIPEGQYEPLTLRLVSYLQSHAPNARLIWASTTPVTLKAPPGQPSAGALDPVINGIIAEQNRWAAQVMTESGIPIDDLYGLMSSRLSLARGDQFHWTPAGSKVQGAAVAAAIQALLPRAGSLAVNYYVSPQGQDTFDGSELHPFATLERARSAVRSLFGQPSRLAAVSEVIVNLRGGTYLRAQTFALGAADSGSANIPVVYRSFPGESARLVGGAPLLPDWFKPVAANAPAWKRLSPAAQSHVVVVNLPAHGITQFGELLNRGMHLAASGAMALYVDSRPLPLAQWPKADAAPLQALGTGFARTGQVLSPQSFVVDGADVGRWASADQAWLHGYWGNLWADSHLRLKAVNPVDHSVTLAELPRYKLKAGEPFRIYNLLEELTSPGDWYLDRVTGDLYVWPTPDWSKADIVVSTLPGELIALKDAHDIVLEHLTLELSWNHLLSITGGDHNTVRGCVLRNAGTDGATISGTHNGITDSTIDGTGDCGVRLDGGSRAQLIPAFNYVRNSRLRHFSQWTWTYAPGVEIHGVGQLVVNNQFTQAPHAAILFFGNEHRIELNDIHQVCLFSSDAGAIYGDRRWDYRGTRIDYNFIHDLKSPLEAPGVGQNGIYLDDALSGIEVRGNVLYRISGDAILSNGGRNNLLERNLIVECGNALETTAYAVRHSTSKPGDTWNLVERLSDDGVQYRAEPWASTYPELARIPNDWAAIRAPGALWLYPEGSRFDLNLCYGNRVFIKKMSRQDIPTIDRVFEIKDNVDNRTSPFADEAAFIAAVRTKAASVRLGGVPPIALEAIGPQ